MKMYRQMAFAGTASLALPIGLLDNAAVFSPTQAMIDLETNEAVYKLMRGMEVDQDTACVDLINELTFCTGRTYVETEHTLRHFRRVGWNPKLFDRTYHDQTEPAAFGDRRVLDRAERAWRELVAAEPPVEIDPKMAAEIERIVECAREELLQCSERRGS